MDVWVILYFTIAFVCSVRFARFLADNDDAFGHDAVSRAGAVYIGIVGGVFWPVMLVIAVVYYYAFVRPEKV